MEQLGGVKTLSYCIEEQVGAGMGAHMLDRRMRLCCRGLVLAVYEA